MGAAAVFFWLLVPLFVVFTISIFGLLLMCVVGLFMASNEREPPPWTRWGMKPAPK